MAFGIIENLKRNDASVYFNPKFRAIVEDHINVLRTTGISVTPIALQHFYKYEGNFYGYLTEHGVSRRLHWIYLRVNNMHHPHEFAKAVRDPLNKSYDPVLIEPSEDLIADLVKYFMSMKD